MNALLNNMSSFPPSLGYNQPFNFGAYQNFMTPNLSVGTDSLSNALANIPMGSYGNMMGFPSMNSTQNSQSNLKNLLEEGIISDEEYKSQLRKMNGFYSKEEIAETERASQSPAEALSGSELKAARKSHKGNYAVTKQHSAVASQLVEMAKESLQKDPAMTSEKDLQTVAKIFAQVNKNPMLAEAFLKEANEVSFSGETKTLLGKYEAALAKNHGYKAAKEEIAGIKEKFELNVAGRNSAVFSSFEEDADKDSSNIKPSGFDKASNWATEHPVTTGTGAVVGGSALLYGAGKAIGKFGFVKTGKVGLALAAIALTAACVHEFTSKK